MNYNNDFSAAIAALETHGDYRVLRGVDHGDLPSEAEDAIHRIGIVVDIETTGLDPSRDSIIELALRLFWTTFDGEIVALGPSMSWLEDPGVPLSPEIVRLTGLTDADLNSRCIDDAVVCELLIRADFIVAHNARFDRPFVERRFPTRRGLAWCCSCHDLDWPALGFEGRGLGWLLAQCGYFHAGHRAAADVDATLGLLRHVLRDGRTGLAAMLDAAERPGWIVSAVGAHFDVKDALRVRGYSWDANLKVWRREVSDACLADEQAWLAMNVYRQDCRPRTDGPAISSVTWTTRYARD